jgi:hypothetical protein
MQPWSDRGPGILAAADSEVHGRDETSRRAASPDRPRRRWRPESPRDPARARSVVPVAEIVQGKLHVATPVDTLLLNLGVEVVTETEVLIALYFGSFQGIR